MLFKNWLNLLMVLICLLTLPIEAEQSYQLTSHQIYSSHRISLSDGLANRSVLALAQDKQGFIWLATNSGIQKFDGVRFQHIRSDAGQPNSLPGNGIFALYVGSQSNLWAGVRNGGLVRISIDSGEIDRLTINGYSKFLVENYYVLSICEDRQGSLWAATSSGLKKADRHTGVIEPIALTKGPSVERIHRVICLDDNVFALSGSILFKLDRVTGQTIGYRELAIGIGNNINDFSLTAWNHQLLAGSKRGMARVSADLMQSQVIWPAAGQTELVRTITPQDHQLVWIGTENQGALLIDPLTGKVHRHLKKRAERPEQGIYSQSIYDLMIDRQGLLWIAGEGLEWVSTQFEAIKTFSNVNHKQSTNNDDVIHMHVNNNDDSLWQLSLPDGLLKIDKDRPSVSLMNDEFNQTWRQSGGPKQPYATVLYPAGDHKYWISANQGFVFWDRKQQSMQFYQGIETKQGDKIKRGLDIIRANNNTFWFAQYGGVLSFDEETKQFNKITLPNKRQDKVVEFLARNDGLIWLLTSENLFLLDPFQQQINQIEIKQTSALAGQFVSMRALSNNQLWIVGDGGLTLATLDNNEIIFSDVDTRQVSNNTFHSLAIDDNQHLWLTSSQGIYWYRPEIKSFKHFDKGYGVAIQDFFDRSSLKLSNGHLLFGGVGGWVLVAPEKLNQEIPPPSLHLWSYQLGEQPRINTTRSDLIEMTTRDHWLNLEFSALDFYQPRRNQLQYYLQGFDQNWRHADYQSSINDSGLPAGKYQLQIKSASMHSAWNEQPLTINLIVTPPWYQSKLAYFCYALVSMAIVLAFIYQRHNALLAVARQQIAEKASESKSLFLANTSHEIRTPINGVVGTVELLKETQLTDEQKEYLHSIKISGENLLYIVNDILDLSKIEAGQMSLEHHPFNLRECIEFALDVFANESEKKQTELLFIADPNIPLQVISDSTRLRQVLVNLLGNAIKFTQQGSVILKLEHCSQLEGKHSVKFRCIDTGTGIPVEKQAKVFQAFQQADSSVTRTHGGTGLGLSISKEIVEKLGGKISIKSEVGIGTEFYFTIDLAQQGDFISINPICKTSYRWLGIAFSDWQKQFFEHLRLGEWLMVDDHEKVSEIEWNQCDGILIESRTLNSETLLKLLDRLKTNKPKYLLTTPHRFHTEFKAVEQYFNQVLLKPLRQNTLLTKLNILQKNHSNSIHEQQYENENEILSQQYPLTILLAEDNAVNQKILIHTFRKLGYEITMVSNGHEILAALERKSFELLITDEQMPGMDGLQAITIIRSQPRFNSMKIILSSANQKPEHLLLKEQGVIQQILTKPLKLSLLKQCLIEYSMLNRSKS